MALFLGPASPAPYGPTTRHGTRFPGPHATTSRVTSPHQGHAPCSRYDSASLITAHPLTTSWHVPSFQAGPSAPALTRIIESDGPDTTVTSPSRSGRALRPARTRLGPDSSWPACHPSRPSATGYSGPECFSHTGSSHSQSQLWTCRSGTQQVQARSTWMPQRPGGLLFGDGVEVVLDNSLARPLLPRGSSTPAIHARAPRLGRAQRRWGGSTPNHPAALQTGMQMGFEPPGQHEQSINQIVSCLAPNTTSRDTPEGGSLVCFNV